MGGIAVLGWGSLIWDRDGLPVDLPEDHEWYPDGPVLPIEFVRQSNEGHLTLVIWEGAGKRIKTRWAPLKVGNLEEAILSLREREGRTPKTGIRIRTKHVGRWTRGEMGNASATIGHWADAMPFDQVIWTALPPKWNGVDEDFPCRAQAVAHLKKLVSEGKEAKAEEYVRKAPEWVRTPYRDAFEQELGWTPRP